MLPHPLTNFEIQKDIIKMKPNLMDFFQGLIYLK